MSRLESAECFALALEESFVQPKWTMAYFDLDKLYEKLDGSITLCYENDRTDRTVLVKIKNKTYKNTLKEFINLITGYCSWNCLSELLKMFDSFDFDGEPYSRDLRDWVIERLDIRD